jgi:hypothetical protein
MKIINPAEISGKIMTLIDQSNEFLIIISPYNKVLSWQKFVNRINKAKHKNIKIDWYIRENVEGNINEIKQLGIIPTEIPNLHCKIYLNEKHAIISSMNLHYYSDTNSIDIAYQTETIKEFNEILEFIECYIKPFKEKSIDLNNIKGLSLKDLLLSYIIENKLINTLEKEIINTKKNINIRLSKFKYYYEILIELDSSPRLIINIEGDYKFRSQKYLELQFIKNKLEEEINCNIDFGNQMKRLKFQLYEIDNQRKIILDNSKAIIKIDKIINVLNKYLN